MVWWSEADSKWTGTDVPDLEETKRPDYRPDWSKCPHGMDALGGADPFIMEVDGQCMLFASSGLADGPLVSLCAMAWACPLPMIHALRRVSGRVAQAAAKIRRQQQRRLSYVAGIRLAPSSRITSSSVVCVKSA